MNLAPPQSLQEYIQRLSASRELLEISTPVDPYLEIAEITRRTVQNGGPALLFTNVKGSIFPVATNLYGSQKRLEIAFGCDIEDRINTLITLFTETDTLSFQTLWKKKRELYWAIRSAIPSKKRRWLSTPKSLEKQVAPVDLSIMPMLTSWNIDGGPFITLPLVYTESISHPHKNNLGMYRIQRFDSTTTGMHWQIGKGGGFHFHEAEARGQNLPVAIFVGGPPALTLAAIAPLPENISEMLFASFLLKRPLPQAVIKDSPYPIPCEADFTLIGHVPAHIRRQEGPFGDHFGYVSLAHDFPLFRCEKMFHRADAIYPATVVGPPPQEDLYLGEQIQKIFNPILPVIIPSLQEIHTYAESGFHALGAIKIRERYEKEALATSLRILGEGQLSLTKVLITVDRDAPSLRQFKDTFVHLLERLRGEEDIIILSRTAHDTLDYTGPSLNRGSKVLFIGTGKEPRKKLPITMPEKIPRFIADAQIYCPGCLVVQLSGSAAPQEIADRPEFADWPCIVISDDSPSVLCQSQLDFLWRVFTRFEPARDLYFKSVSLVRNSASYQLPMVIDARMKPSYPPVLKVDPETEQLVTKKWHLYHAKA